MDFITSACYFLFVSALLPNLGWLVRGQTPTPTTAPDPALFFAIIVVVAIIAVILIGAVVALIVICFVYYCCSPVPNPEHLNVRTNPVSEGEPVLDPLPPDYVDHDKYPRQTLSQRSRASLPRYSIIFQKTRRARTSQRDRNSDVERSSQRERTSERSRGATSLTQSLPQAIDAVELVVHTETEDSAI